MAGYGPTKMWVTGEYVEGKKRTEGYMVTRWSLGINVSVRAYNLLTTVICV